MVICSNALVLGLGRVGLTDEEETKLEYANLWFFAFFIFELILKLLGQGFKNYLRDRFNWFDGGVVLLSAIDISLIYTLDYSGSGSGAITALRVLRLIRIFQLFKNWRTLQELLKVIMGTLRDLFVILLLIGLLVYIYMLVGMELYAYKDSPNSDIPSNFNGLLNSFITVFIVLANDGWSHIYFSFYQISGFFSSTVYFLSLLIFGQYIILNLLVAIIIENFEYVSVKNDLIDKINSMK
jgi:Ion transport protein